MFHSLNSYFLFFLSSSLPLSNSISHMSSFQPSLHHVPFPYSPFPLLLLPDLHSFRHAPSFSLLPTHPSPLLALSTSHITPLPQSPFLLLWLFPFYSFPFSTFPSLSLRFSPSPSTSRFPYPYHQPSLLLKERKIKRKEKKRKNTLAHIDPVLPCRKSKVSTSRGFAMDDVKKKLLSERSDGVIAGTPLTEGCRRGGFFGLLLLR